MAALALLNLVAMILNLAPVPPLDGFQAIAPYLPDEIREKAMTPPLTYIIFFWRAYEMALR